MQQPSIMRSLLWKDTKTIAPLAIAIWTGILLVNCLAAVGAALSGLRDATGAHVALWILMPNLMAIGTPALLIGTEEESGTLSWLRSLPVAWQRIVDSKFIIAVAATFITWCLASLMALVTCYREVFVTGSQAGLMTILNFVFFSCVLLVTGFVLCYLFRSPVVALVSLVPVMYFIATMVFAVAAWIITGHFGMSVGSHRDASGSELALIFSLGAGFLLLLWLTQRWLGRRRLVSPKRRSRIAAAVSLHDENAYRPALLMGRPIGFGRPSQIGALLWQQSRQLGWATFGLTVTGLLILLFNYNTPPHRQPDELGSIAVIFIPVMLGAFVFYGDNVRRQVAFFADRGIGPTQVWWTRMLIPASGCLVLSLAILIEFWNQQVPIVLSWYIVWMGFAAGQLVSMWVARPMLSFFAAPIYLCTYLALAMSFFMTYFEFRWIMCLMIPTLLVATWSLTERWMASTPTIRFHTRSLGFSLAALIIPIALVGASRVATTPSIDNAWRAKAMAATDKMDWDVRYGSAGTWFTRNAMTNNSGGWYVDRSDTPEKLRDELAADVVGAHVQANQLVVMLDRQQPFGYFGMPTLVESRRDAVKVALKWSREIRERVIAGETGLEVLEGSAELLEHKAVELMTTHPTWLGAKPMSELVDLIPSAELRSQSRKTALLREWRRYQNAEWKRRFKDETVIRTFMGHRLFLDWQPLGIESRRSDRYVDKTVAQLWDQLDGQLPAAHSTEANRRAINWSNSVSPAIGSQQAQYGYYLPNLGHTWTSDHENNIRKLQQTYGTKSSSTNSDSTKSNASGSSASGSNELDSDIPDGDAPDSNPNAQ